MHTARIVWEGRNEAPLWLADETPSVATRDGGANYDPADATFHARYLAFLGQMRAHRLCQDPTVVMMYAGYASSSYGDEYIGPHGSEVPDADRGKDPALVYTHVKERLDAWAGVCENATSKVLMGGESAYGSSLGFGTRNGFVEHYWYLIPSDIHGQSIREGDHDPYLRVNDSALLLRGGQMLGDENEEYQENWSSDWRTASPSSKGGAYDADASPQGSAARWGPYASFPYRFMMATLRALQMRVSYLIASPWDVVNDHLFAYVGLELGRTADDAPDAWCLMASTEFDANRGVVSNIERFLYQRDEPVSVEGGVLTFPDARVSQTPSFPSNVSVSGGSWMSVVGHDWLAHAAPRGVIGFEIDRRFIHSAAAPLQAAAIKVSLFDVLPGSVSLTQAHRALVADGGAPHSLGTFSTTGDGALKTYTFISAELYYRTDEEAHPSQGHKTFPHAPNPYDFEVRAHDANGTPQTLVVSMVRVIKLSTDPSPSPPPSPAPPPPPSNSCPTNGECPAELPHPTWSGAAAPYASCWHYYPDGCTCATGADANCNPEAADTWFRDTWGEQNSNADTYAGCASRAGGKNSWCGIANTLFHFVSYEPPPSPPPSPPPCYITEGTSGLCDAFRNGAFTKKNAGATLCVKQEGSKFVCSPPSGSGAHLCDSASTSCYITSADSSSDNYNSCADTKKKCSKKKSKGKCDRRPRAMAKKCPKTCGFCPGAY